MYYVLLILMHLSYCKSAFSCKYVSTIALHLMKDDVTCSLAIHVVQNLLFLFGGHD